MEIVLSPWGKVLVMAIGASVVLLTLLVVVCFLGPGCYGYECLHADEERERRRRREAAAAMASNDLKLSAIKRTSSVYDTVGSASSLIGRMSHRDSTYSSMSEATERSASFRSVGTVDSGDSAGGDASRDGPPVLALTLQYLAAEDTGAGKLLVGIKSVTRLPPRDYVGSLEPFVLLQVVRTSWPLHRRAGAPLHQMRTRALRHSYNPHFDQTFVLDARRSELKDWCLKIAVFDQDRFGNPTELCHQDVALREIKTLSSCQEALLSYTLQPSIKETGELLLGLSYLPTAQRLSVSIIKAAHLKYLEVADSLANFMPFVRVIQLHGCTGRSVKRKKTAARVGSEAPEFNETLTFDLNAAQLESSAFLVMLCSRPGAEEEAKDPRARPPKDVCLGKVALGRQVGVKRARDHWLSIMQTPRTVVSSWHTLK